MTTLQEFFNKSVEGLASQVAAAKHPKEMKTRLRVFAAQCGLEMPKELT